MDQEKRELLKNFSSANAQQQMLSQMIGQELLYRKAFKEGLPDKPQIKSLIEETRRSLLAQQLLAGRMAKEIQLSESDLQEYYDSHQKEFEDKQSDEVKGEIYQLLRRQEESKVQQKFLKELHKEFNVALHLSKLQGSAKEETNKDQTKENESKE